MLVCFLPGCGRFQSLNTSAQKKICSHFKGIVLYSKYALKYLLHRKKEKELKGETDGE